MTIERVDYNQEKRRGKQGVVITFTYDTKLPDGSNVADAYEIFGEPDYPIAMNLLAMSSNPEHLMINIRSALNITVH